MALKPPLRHVKTVQHLIYWLYAELVARAAGFRDNYDFVMSRYKKLKSGEMEWSSTIRDHQKEWEKDKTCAYCGVEDKLSVDHIVPVWRAGVDPRVGTLLKSPDNSVWACEICNRSKGDRDVFEWYGHDRLDEIPKLVLSKLLKLAHRLHETHGTLALKDANMDGVLDIYDPGIVMTHLLSRLTEQPVKR